MMKDNRAEATSAFPHINGQIADNTNELANETFKASNENSEASGNRLLHLLDQSIDLTDSPTIVKSRSLSKKIRERHARDRVASASEQEKGIPAIGAKPPSNLSTPVRSRTSSSNQVETISESVSVSISLPVPLNWSATHHSNGNAMDPDSGAVPKQRITESTSHSTLASLNHVPTAVSVSGVNAKNSLVPSPLVLPSNSHSAPIIQPLHHNPKSTNSCVPNLTMERSGPKALEKLNTADHVSSSGTSSQPSSGRHHGAHSRSGCSFTATPQNSTKLSALSLSPATSAASHTKSRTSSGSTSTIMSLHGLQSAPMANERQFLIALDTAPKCATVEDDNDRIVQERLLEAKALERKNVSGAVMHQFSLWNKAQPAATKLNDPEEAGTLSPRITTNKLCSMSSSQCTVSETANSGNGSHKKPSKLRGPKAAREVHHSLQEEEPRGLAPSATAQQQHHHHLLQQQQHQHQQQHKPTSPSSGKKTCGGVFPTTAGGTPCEESKTATNTSMDGEALDGDYTMEFEAIDDENAKQASATENIPSFSASGSLAAALRMKVGSAKHSLPSTGSDGSLGSESKQHVYSTPEKSTTSPSALTSFDRSKERAAVAVALAFESGEQQAESDGGWNSDEDLVEEDEELQRLSANRPRSAGGNDSAAADLEADLAVSAAIKSMSQSGPAAFATQPARRALLGDYTGGNGNSNTAGVQEDISTSKLAMRRATTSGDNRHFVDKFEHLISTAAAAGGSGGGGGGGGLGTESNQSLKSMTSRSASECNISFEPSELHSQSAKSSSTKYQVLRNLRSNKSSQKNLDRMELSAQFHLSMMEAEAQEEGQNKSSNSNCNDDAPPPTAAAAAASFSVVQPSLASSHGIPSEEYEQGVLAPDREEEDAPSPTLSEFSDAEEPLELHQEQQRQRQALSPLRVEIAGEAQTLEALRERTSSADRNQIDLEDGEDSPLRWRKGEVIGEGTFGKVYKGMNEKTGELLAIKQLCMVDGTSVEVDSLCKEISVMWNLEHENIVRYMGTSKTERYLYIILEYVTGGSIAGMITQFGPFNEKLMRRFTLHIMSGVEYLHSKGIIHRDIKGANILVSDAGVAKLADFGCSKQLAGMCTASIEESMLAIRGSVPWMAPEVIKQSGHGRASDIWSVGATVIEMATGKPPWSEFTNSLAALFHVATSKSPPPVPPDASPLCADFLTRCMVIDPAHRATAQELLRDCEYLHGAVSSSSFSNTVSATASASARLRGESINS